MSILEADGLVGLIQAVEKNQQIIANNLANVDTPEYRTVRLRFSTALEDLLDESGALRPGSPIETEMYQPRFPADAEGNNVSLEREIVELTKNTLRMKLHLAALAGQISRMRMAINGR